MKWQNQDFFTIFISATRLEFLLEIMTNNRIGLFRKILFIICCLIYGKIGDSSDKNTLGQNNDF